MKFSFQPQERRLDLTVLPMVNVVFLLLVFFLMTAQLAPPEPFEVTRPKAAEGADPDSETVLYVGKGGALQFRDSAGDAVFETLAELAGENAVLQLRIEATLDGDRLAQVMKKLAAAGYASVEVVVDPQ